MTDNEKIIILQSIKIDMYILKEIKELYIEKFGHILNDLYELDPILQSQQMTDEIKKNPQIMYKIIIKIYELITYNGKLKMENE